MLSPIFEELLGEDRYIRFNGITSVLTVSTANYEIRVSSTHICLDKVQFNMYVVNPHHGIPYNRQHIALIDYGTFLSGEEDEVFGITKDDVEAVLELYKRNLA